MFKRIVAGFKETCSTIEELYNGDFDDMSAKETYVLFDERVKKAMGIKDED